jgi:hypothetical protein
MRAAGVTARDLNPALNSLGSVMGRLASLDQQTLVKLFGAENLDISNVLAANAQGFDAMQKKMQDSAGAGQRFESAITDNVAGSIKKLMNTVTDAQITLGSQTNGMLKGMVDGLTSFVRSASTGMNDLTSQLSGGDEQGQLNRMTEAFANLQERLKGAQSAGQVKDIAEQIQFLGKQIVRLESDTQSGRLLDVLTFGLTGPSQDTMTKVAELGKQVSDVVKQVATDTDSILADNAKAAAARAEMEKARVAAMDPDLALYPPGTTSSLLAGPELPANFDLEARRESVKLAQEREEIERKAAAQEQRRADYMGDTSRADKLERELNILNEQRRIMQEFGMGEGEARDLAIRAINARKKDEPERQAALVASNLQSIGGGGGVFGGVANLPQRQVALSEQMLVEAKKTNDLLRPDTRSAVSEKSSTEMTSLLRTIAQNTSRSSILRVSNN